MNISEYRVKARQKYLEKAKTADFLNAVFFIAYYNTCINSGRPPKLTDIEPQEVFEKYNANEYATALARAKALLNKIDYIGAAAHKYPGLEPYQEAFAKMKNENPGFTGECYDLVVNEGLQKLR
jgi:hypothetical protein